MKRVLFLSLCLLLTLLTSQAQYQIINGGFEDWEGSGDSREPVRWSSFMTIDLASSLYSSAQAKQIEECTSDLRPGTTGTKCIRTWARAFSIIGINIIANGQFTTGRVHAGSTSPGNSANNNYTNTSDPNFNQPMIGKPDSIYFWAKAVLNNSTQEARMSTIIHSNHAMQDPEISANDPYVVARATRNFTQGAQNWVQYKVPFVYTSNNVTPAFILVTFTTNKTAGEGAGNQSLYVLLKTWDK
jgi:hypothetical protein